jgi:D-glycero-alpha-D-manno-heptose 1-phosphate guanylyltransferase
MSWRRPTEIIVLAGGFGTRLRPLISDVPKPMAPVGGRPFLELLLDYWITQGIGRFVLSTGYLGEKIESHFGDRYRGYGVDYAREPVPLGTGGGLRHALFAHSWQQDEVVVVNGDTWYEVSLDTLFLDARDAGSPVTLAAKPISDNDRYGGIEIGRGNRVAAFGVRKSGPCLINGGCYLVKTADVKPVLAPYPDAFSLESEFLVPLAAREQVAASIQDVPFLDIGVPADYEMAPTVIGRNRSDVSN